jgi:hypothetical protein
MSDKNSSDKSANLERAIQMVRDSKVVRLDMTVGQLLDELREKEKKGELEAAKVTNGGVVVTKCFLIATKCE